MAADSANDYLPSTPYTLLASDLSVSVPQLSTAGLASLSISAAGIPNIAAYSLAANTAYNIVIYSGGFANIDIVHKGDTGGLAASIVYGGGLLRPPTGAECKTGYLFGFVPTTGTWAASIYCAEFYISA